LPRLWGQGPRRDRPCHVLDGCAFLAAVETLTGERPERVAESKQSFDYHDENGRLLYQVERIDLNGFKNGKRNKKFIQRRPNGNGGWISDLDGVRRVPYRLPELKPQATGI
jgi:hypothetical protein